MNRGKQTSKDTLLLLSIQHLFTLSAEAGSLCLQRTPPSVFLRAGRGCQPAWGSEIFIPAVNLIKPNHRSPERRKHASYCFLQSVSRYESGLERPLCSALSHM